MQQPLQSRLRKQAIKPSLSRPVQRQVLRLQGAPGLKSSGRLSLASREKQRNPFRRLVLLADRHNRDHDRQSNKGACNAPEEAPEKHHEQDDERRHRQGGAGNLRLEITPDDELDEVQTYEHGKADLPGSGLDQHEKCGEYGRNKRTKKRYVIQNKSDYAPRGRELDAGNQGKTPHHD